MKYSETYKKVLFLLFIGLPLCTLVIPFRAIGLIFVGLAWIGKGVTYLSTLLVTLSQSLVSKTIGRAFSKFYWR